jgi:hypothetical protein
MSRDPFESLRGSNPLPEDHPVHPPMAAAERILGSGPRHVWPAWALAAGLAAAVLVGGGAWLLFLHRGGQHAVTTVTSTTSTTSLVPGFPEADAVVYFFVQDDGTQVVPGPYLIPVARPYAILEHQVTDPIYESLDFLLSGVYPGEEAASPALTSEIPEGSELLGVQVADGVADVDLSARFFSGGDGPDLRGRIAQVVFTLTRLPEIDAVRFWQGGQIVGFDETVGVSYPVVRADFPDLLPPVMIESPAYWASAGDNPLAVTGTADVFEATVSLELLDQDGAVLWQGTTQASCGTGCRGDFSAEIPYEVAEGQSGTLVAWETSMEDGSRLYQRRHPVWLNATPGVTTTTGPVATLLAERYDLDKALDAQLEELAGIDAQLVGLPLDQGTELRTRAAELDRYVGELRDGLSRVYDELRSLDAEFPIPCSAEALGSELEGQPDLPAAVADLRTHVYEAARACDWEALSRLLDPATFSYSFGESGDPVGFWQREEFLHYQPMLYIAGMLARPFGTVPGDVVTIYAWPSAQAYASWTDVPQVDKEALRPLYGDGDFASFAEFGGYLGYRVGFSWDGTRAIWIYAITGD